ncbi:MAG: hypothetical protein HYZ63_01920, partial [Candidatus Andersenbacteria bacterium]|nr:hypothetical protein [Candidatus Andersenbacteria bacterium]
MTTTSQRALLFTLPVVAVLALCGLLLGQVYQSYLGARSPKAEELSESLIGGELDIKNLAKGNHKLEFLGKTKDGKAISDTVAFTIPEGVYRAVVPTSICVAAQPFNLQIRGRSLPNTGYGVEWRVKGTAQWGHITEPGVHASRSGDSFFIAYPFDVPGAFEFGKIYEIRFFSDLGNVYEFSTGSRPPDSAQRQQLCAERRVTFDTLPNVDPLPSGIIVSNFKTIVDGNKLSIAFTTNKPVFLGQMKIQFRLATTEQWVTFADIGLSESFYRETTDHVVSLASPDTQYFQQSVGSPYELRVTDKNNNPLGPIHAFMSLGNPALQFMNVFLDPSRLKIERSTNGFLVQWRTNQPATSKLEASGLTALSYDDLIISHVLPVALPSNANRNFTVTTTRPSTNESLTKTGSSNYSTNCSFSVLVPDGFTSNVNGEACLAQVGVGPTAKTSGVDLTPTMPWAVYCSGSSVTKQITSCYLCQFPGANFGGAIC